MIRKTAASVGDDAPGLGAALREKLVLPSYVRRPAITLMVMPCWAAFFTKARAYGCTCGNKVAIAFSLRSSTRLRAPTRTAADSATDVLRGGPAFPRQIRL